MSQTPGLTDEQVARWVEFLGSKAANGPCESCGAQVWGAAGLFDWPLAKFYAEPFMDPYGSSVSVVAWVCQNCRNLRIFPASYHDMNLAPTDPRPLPPAKPTNVQVRTSRGEQVAVADFTLGIGEEAIITGEYAVPMKIQVSPKFKLHMDGVSSLPVISHPDGMLVTELTGSVPFPAQTTLTVAHSVTRSTAEGDKQELEVTVHLTAAAVVPEPSTMTHRLPPPGLGPLPSGTQVQVHLEQYHRILSHSKGES